MEIWGGIECTINRIGHEFKDQLDYSDHYNRSGDLEAIAGLGIKTIRYPVLWEKHQPEKNADIDWTWAEQRLQTIRDLGMKPIAGLLHHGSGPLYTNLLDDEFPFLFAAYAYEVACRFPWICDYTPINEPLTTARFSGLYGFWYPHQKDERLFYKMLLNQLKATVLAMEAIRSVNPAARLVQTEDLGKTYSTVRLAYQAVFENERRFLTFDILSGRLQPGHRQYQYMLDCGIQKEDIDFFQLHECKPNVLGLNYYITSERWLDEFLENYASDTHGRNGIDQYADTEVVRANPKIRGGFKMLATEIWERYNIPMAVTECHLHCTREEQLRWFKEILDQATNLQRMGVQIAAVTAWALLGSFDWDTLLTKTGTQYESGVFDIKALEGQLRPTAMATLIKNLHDHNGILHPVLSAPGWWHPEQGQTSWHSRPVVIIAGESKNSISGDISMALETACCERRIHLVIVQHEDGINLNQLNPWAIIHPVRKNIRAQSDNHKYLRIHFRKGAGEWDLLKFIIDEIPMNMHQINKILDILIDGDPGCWSVRGRDILLKSDRPIFQNELMQIDQS